MDSKDDLKAGTLVLVHDVDSAFGLDKWILGRIETVFHGQDGRVRLCDVPISVKDVDEKNKKFKILRCPITRLSPLPIDNEVIANFYNVT